MPRIEMIKKPLLVLAALGAVACCPAGSSRTLIERQEDDLDATCEELCMRAIMANEEEFLGCTPGLTEDGDEAVVCLWEERICNERNQCC